jgi:hypothetical protein
MESTGVYWKPVFNVLEDSFEVKLDNIPRVIYIRAELPRNNSSLYASNSI